jgi:glutamine synthetase
VQIEARVMGELCTSHIIPGAVKYQNTLINNIRGLKEIGFDENTYSNQKQILTRINEHILFISDAVEKMIAARKKANALTDSRTMAIAYCDEVKTFFEPIRYHVDKLEMLVDDANWYLPKYRELLFLK